MAKSYFRLGSGQVIESDTPECWASDPNAKRISAAKGKAILVEESRAWLLEQLKPGDTVYCILRHVSASGMSRRIDFYKLGTDRPLFLTGNIAHLLGYRHDRQNNGLVVGGCGMDMGFAVVSHLAGALYRDGFTCIGDKCPSNDHSNGDRNRKPHKHSSGEYALRYAWL